MISRSASGGTVSDTEAMVVLGGFTGAGGRAIAEANGEATDARSMYNAQMYLLRPSDSRWYALAHSGVAPTQRALHCATLVAGSGGGDTMTPNPNPNPNPSPNPNRNPNPDQA